MPSVIVHEEFNVLITTMSNVSELLKMGKFYKYLHYLCLVGVYEKSSA